MKSNKTCSVTIWNVNCLCPFLFFFQFCEVGGWAILHARTYPDLAIGEREKYSFLKPCCVLMTSKNSLNMAIQEKFLKIWGIGKSPPPPQILGRCCSSSFFLSLVRNFTTKTRCLCLILYLSWKNIPYNRVIRKVRKTQRQYPEFGHTHGEIKKKPAKKYISIQRGMKLRKFNFGGKSVFHPVCPFSWAPAVLLHIFSLVLIVQLL